jgi:hypothetical protein
MKTFEKCAAQGDVMFIRVATIPNGLTEQNPNDKGELVIAHSETGHDHVMVLDRSDALPAAQMFNGDNPLISWLKVNRPTALDHKRDHHRHDSIQFQPGMYEIRRQREQRPEGWRRVAD